MDITVRRTIALTCAAACTVFAGSANATVLYNSSGSYFITTIVNDNIHIDNTTAIVTVDLNGRVRGVDTLTPVYREAAARVQRGVLNVIGNGRIIAGLNQSAIEMTSSSTSEVHIGGRSVIHGNIKSDMAPIWGDPTSATQRLFLEGNSVVSGTVLYGGYVQLKDNAVVAGDIKSNMNANVRVDITGGSVQGSVVLGGLDVHIVNMSGGSIAGSLGGAPSYVDIDLSGGYIRQGLISRGEYDGVIRGGNIDGGVWIKNDVAGGSNLSVRGGRIDTIAGAHLFAMTEMYSDSIPSTVKICGGQFGYFQKGTGLRIEGNTSLEIRGAGLTYAGGILTGTLQDGSTINVPLSFGPTWSGTFNLITVATPSRPTC
ncbi:MAG: hypothetical protein ABW171_00680 [Steroidobacter sp.]